MIRQMSRQPLLHRLARRLLLAAALFAVAPAPLLVAPATAQTLAEQQEGLLSEAERKALQDALVWSGHYEGRVDGAFGPATRRAIGAFQREQGYRDTGYLRQRHVDRLLGIRDAQTSRLGWEVRRFPELGMQLGIPAALFGPPVETEIGLRFASKSNQPQAELLLFSAVPMSDRRFEALREEVVDRRTFGRDIYEAGERDWFVFSGRSGKGVTQYTYVVNRNVGVRGFSFRYLSADAEKLARVNVALYNSLEAFEAKGQRPDPGADDATAGRGNGRGDGRDDRMLFSDDELARLEGGGRGERRRDGADRADRTSSGFLVSEDGYILTTSRAVRGCEQIWINDRAEASLKALHGDADLALLQVPTGGRKFPTLTLSSRLPKKGDAVRLVYYAADARRRDAAVEEGRIDALQGPNSDFRRLQVAARLTGGNRGGPLIDAQGRVTGLIHGPAVGRGGGGDDDQRELTREERVATNSLILQAFLAANGVSYRAGSGEGDGRIGPATRRATVAVECIE